MEGWQKLHIKKKLPYLIETTICSVRLKAGLLAKDLLSDEEDERLVRFYFMNQQVFLRASLPNGHN